MWTQHGLIHIWILKKVIIKKRLHAICRGTSKEMFAKRKNAILLCSSNKKDLKNTAKILRRYNVNRVNNNYC